MSTRLLLTLMVLTAILFAGCPWLWEADHGMGKCKEYKPICITGQSRCVQDKRGCELCTCEERK